jgi:flavin reductase (DIM6/NTAB) family NADH-FMN oxidoreductase RutF
MTIGWHTVMEFAPSLIGCVIAGGNHSFELIRRSKECVVSVPTAASIDKVVGIGNCSGAEVDKLLWLPSSRQFYQTTRVNFR